MHKTILSATLALLLLGSTSSVLAQSNTKLHLIPSPKEAVLGSGSYQLSSASSFTVKGKEAKTIARFFADKIRTSTGFDLPINNKTKDHSITLSLDRNILGDETYTLEVTPTQVTAKAKTAKGLFYAMQSLMQLFPAQIETPYKVTGIKWEAPSVSIKDAPRFDYRGIMLDVCRHFLTVDEVKRQLDVLSLFKINYLHFHLTEDQAWRIEIKKYPELTRHGAYRTEGDGTRYGGYYTQEDIKEIVAYAAERHIEIIPELEMPGHELAAISAYNWLSCTGKEVKQPRILWGVEDIVMCPGKESTFTFLENVIKEMVKLFPCKYFHIGGDESPRSEWKKCALCQQRIKELGIDGSQGHSPEAQLQSYVVCRMEKFLNKYGKSIIGWDEILEGGNLNKSAIVMSWRGEQGGIQAAKSGHKAIMTPSSHGLYLDFYQDQWDVSPVAIGGYSPLQKVYNYDPIPEKLASEGKGNYIWGVQGNLWAEYLYSTALYEYRLYPRATAVAEIGWASGKKDFNSFAKTVDEDTYIRLQAHGVKFHVPLPTQVGGSSNQVAFHGEKDVKLTTVRPEKIVYTLDGTMPSPSSKEFNTLKITENTTLRVATLLPCGIMSPTRTIEYQKQDYAPAINEKGKSLQAGLKLKLTRGLYVHSADLDTASRWETKVIGRIEDIRGQQNRDYSAIAEGYVEIPEDGIYRVASHMNEVWIDGVKLVDNDQEIAKRSDSHSGSRALKKGKHAIRVMFIGNEVGGYPSYWDGGSVTLQKEGGKALAITAEQLFH